MKLAMWVFMLVCNLIAPAAMIGFGRRFLKNPPKERNGLYGYRTARSMKSQGAWDFAQRYMGELWWKIGWALVPLAVLGQVLTLPCPTMESMCLWSIAPCAVEVTVMLIAALIPVERALKENFDENGRRRRKEELP